MIITCPNCQKKFQIDPSLVPEEGRDLNVVHVIMFGFIKEKMRNALPLSVE
jgi:predicted Zn finger-like uncharacterized protein